MPPAPLGWYLNPLAFVEVVKIYIDRICLVNMSRSKSNYIDRGSIFNNTYFGHSVILSRTFLCIFYKKFINIFKLGYNFNKNFTIIVQSQSLYCKKAMLLLEILSSFFNKIFYSYLYKILFSIQVRS